MSEPHSIARDDQESAKNVEDGGDIHSNSLGAPVEAENPLGYDVGFTSAVVLNVSRMIGARFLKVSGLHGSDMRFVVRNIFDARDNFRQRGVCRDILDLLATRAFDIIRFVIPVWDTFLFSQL